MQSPRPVPPTPDEFISFGDTESFAVETDSDFPDSSTDLAPPVRRAPARHFGLGQPYPAPPNIRYWRSGAAELASNQSNANDRKRKAEFTSGKEKKQKMSPDGKNALMILNERHKGLQYSFADPTGPPHDLCFTVSVVYPPTGAEFSANGRSKKLAKIKVAEMILHYLGVNVPKNMASEPARPLVANVDLVPILETQRMENAPSHLANPYFRSLPDQRPVKEVDFASDDIMDVCLMPVVAASPPPAAAIHRLRKIRNLRENAVLALHCLIEPQKTSFDFVSEEGLPHDKIFTTELHFMDLNQIHQTFIGRAGSKKKSKVSAAVQALTSFFGPDVYAELVARSYSPPTPTWKSQVELGDSMDEQPEIQENIDPFSNQYNTAFADHVRSLVTDKYDEILADDKIHLPNKVLAGIVMTWAYPLVENSAVIAVTTGTKCIEGDFMSTDGLALNDCHAEILATRCLRDYIYSHLEELCLEGISNEHCIFEIVKDGEDGIEKFKLKDGIEFHLFISTSPCGDARIFSPKGLELESDDSLTEPPGDEIMDNHPNRSNRGVLRSKIEAGEGTIPVANLNKGPQTWDAVIQGNALHTMSCSDKLCRWNVVGVQGAVLSNLLDPIYYTSVVLGGLHHPVHLERALYGRIEKLAEDLKLPYKLNRPKLLMLVNGKKREVKKSPNHAVVWVATWSTHEVISSSKGRCKAMEHEVASRLSKRMQFMRFLKIYKNRSGRRDNFVEIYYADAKELATEHKTALKQLMDKFKSAGFGNWIKKPVEQDAFRIGNGN